MIPITESQLSSWIAAFIWPMVRIGAMVVAAPVLSSRQTPAQVRVGLTLLLTWILMPTVPVVEVSSYFSPEAFLITLQQLLIGLMMGFILQMVFGALVFGGQVIAFSMGLGFASMMDPQNGVQVPVVSQFYLIIATLLFLILDGHLVLISLVAQSFHTFPIAVDGVSRNSFRDIVSWGSTMFAGGVLMALPLMAALLLVNLGMGIIGRAAPQLHIFAIGFPITMLIGFVLVWVTLPDVMENFQQLLESGFALMQQILRIPG